MSTLKSYAAQASYAWIKANPLAALRKAAVRQYLRSIDAIYLTELQRLR